MMTMKSYLRSVALLVFVWLSGVLAYGQNIYGFTSLDYDDQNDVVVAECQTIADYASAFYYTVYVSCSIVDNNHNQVAYGSATDSSNAGSVDVVVEADVAADGSYTATSRHNGDIYYYDWDSSCGYGRSCYSYYDIQNFSYWNDQLIDDLRAMDAELPGPEQVVNQQRLHAGNTHDNNAPPRPSILYAYAWQAGAEVNYYLLTSGRCISRQGWWVVEQQTDYDLTSDDNRWGSGTSGQHGPPDGFDDIIIFGGAWSSGQSFFISPAAGDSRHYPVTIEWIDGTQRNPNQQMIVHEADGTVLINGATAPSTKQTRPTFPCPL
jgi:hypothetical protein